ncbi:MAG: dipeptide ABC transporter ATP-binding protein [Anaerolineae bacterium]|nr:MAG: dipeptide ABC transporter ATP-binding protein [Anaerolineae bacterium]
MTTAPLLKIKGLHVHFDVFGGQLKVLDGVDLTVHAGEKVGLVGETGAGKTTTMKAILRILPQPPARIPGGQILFEGRDILKAPRRELAKVRGQGISMIFQDPTAALNPVFTVGAQIAPVVRNSAPSDTPLSTGEIRKWSIAPLKEVALADPERLLGSYPLQLSGGMRQRVCIAMALAASPKLLIADEPGTSLDVTIQDQVLRLLHDLVEQKNMAVILITHSLGVVRERTDRVCVMYAGNIVEEAPTTKLFANPLHPYAQGLMTAVPKLTGGGVSDGIPGRMPVYLDPPKGCRFHPRCSHVMDICRREKPPQYQISQDRKVACFLHEDYDPAKQQRHDWKQDLPIRIEGRRPLTSNLLEVKDLIKYFVIGHKGTLKREPITVKAVDGVSFAVRQGETLGLVGESGSGKSTIAYTIVGMYQPTAGSAHARAQDLFANGKTRPRSLRKDIRIVFQDPGSSLNPRHTIKQILELPVRLHRPEVDCLTEVVRLLDLVDLPSDYMYKYPYMLSGGEKQIIAIARALATEPSLIILDEPTSALDVSVQGKIINLLLRLQREFNLSYLFITHDLSLMRNVADRVAIMYLGKICEVAEMELFFSRPQHPYTQMLLSSIPVTSEEEEQAKPVKVESTGEIPSPVNVPLGCSFHTRCPYVMDICKQVDPVMVETEAGHMTRCHLFEQPVEGPQPVPT